MKLKKQIAFFLLILLLGLAACSGGEIDSGSDLAGAAVSTQPAETVADATEPSAEPAEPTQESAANAPTLEPTPTEAPAIAETEPGAAELEPTATEAEQAPAETQFNGQYESTYFRGAETAAVTMIDYSDFL